MAGRPRKLREEGEAGMNEAPKETVKTVKEEKGEKQYFISDGIGYIKPYLGKDSLEKGKFVEKVDKDGKHYIVSEKVGERRCFFIRCQNEVYKLLSLHSTGRGKAQRLIHVFKTKKKNERGQRDKRIISRLRKEGFPGL